MKKFLFILFSLFVAVFVTLFGISAYHYYAALHVDDPIDPYVSVLSGEVTVVRGEFAVDMEAPETYRLREGDVIITKKNSEATIFWPDRSTTHLSEESKLVIERMRVTQDYSSIELVASLERGKIWTNIIRTLYPESEIRIHLPNQWVVAGVRWTVFEVNLDAGYIHSVDHVVTLKNQLFQSIHLLPGEIVSAWNIMERQARDILDIAWNDANILRDQAYELLRSTEIRDAFDRIAGTVVTENWWDILYEWWDRFVRMILSWFSAFDGIGFLTALEDANMELLASSEAMLFEWYQKLRGFDFVSERDVLRGVMREVTAVGTKAEEYFHILATESLWDRIAFPELSLPSTDTLLDQYALSLDTTLSNIIESITTRDYSSILIERIFFWMNK